MAVAKEKRHCDRVKGALDSLSKRVRGVEFQQRRGLFARRQAREQRRRANAAVASAPVTPAAEGTGPGGE